MVHSKSWTALALVIAGAISVGAQNKARTTLDIYLVDVEGGNATLFVSPSGESTLIDTGNGGPAASRDADRMMAAIKDAGLSTLDRVVTTHWHGDHFGGMQELATRIPIREFADHGPNVQPAAAADAFLQQTYPALYGKAKHTVLKPGDTIKMGGLEWHIVTSAGQAIKTSLPGGGQKNAACASHAPQDADPTENAQSVGSVVTFGRFRVVHMGDLTWNKEFDLMCPTNHIGSADLFVVSHHGQAISNAPVLVHALRPRVAIMNNGTRKGGQPGAMKTLFSSPGLEDVWQLHFSLLSGQEHTVPGLFIANTTDEPTVSMPIAAMPAPPPGPSTPPPPAHDGRAYWIKVSARRDGSFSVTNGRNGFTKEYAAAVGAGRGSR